MSNDETNPSDDTDDNHPRPATPPRAGRTEGGLTRRSLLRAAGLGGAVVAAAPLARTLLREPVAQPLNMTAVTLPGGSLDPTTIPKYVTPLVIPPAMPLTGTLAGGTIDYYEIGVRQFSQQMLPAGYPQTPVWGYGSMSTAGTFHSPGYTIEAVADRPVRVVWSNNLTDNVGGYLPHLLAVDPTLHWSNPPGGISGRDSVPTFTSTPGPYPGPVPTVVHLHGAHTLEQYDGFTDAWYLPAASNIPSGYATVGSHYDQFAAEALADIGVPWAPGMAVVQYANDQRATTLWYHDHALGITRLNVYAGLAAFYLLRGGSSDLPAGVLPGPAPHRGDPAGTSYYEIPIAIQDRSFNTDGSLFFPDSRAFTGDVPASGPFIPTTDVPPIWTPVFFGNTMIANGVTWPLLQVEPRRYRMRLLNGCNDRFLILKIAADPLAPRPATAALPFWMIGTEGGFLPAPTQVDQLTIAPAERPDLIVDFTGLPVGTTLYLINEGPDSSFGMQNPPADPGTTGQVMKFVVTPLASTDTSTPPSQLTLPASTPLGATTKTWTVSLNEEDSRFFPGAPIAFLLGTVSGGRPVPLHWSDTVTENPTLGATELWEFRNFTMMAHPMHLHQVQFQVVGRQPMNGGAITPPDPTEAGFKDTVICMPGQATLVKARFDIPGLFVYHCHILGHEDNEMMRPLVVG